MSGWIKWDKDLESDPRFKRMVNALMKARGIDPCNATPYHVAQHVTVLSGALLRLWAHADTYVREDDTLDMTTEELNSYLGIGEFSSICCPDWLGETEDGHVYLPGFLDKNGPEAKEKAQTAKRVARHRMKKRATVTTNMSNGVALPDQTRLDQTNKKTHTARTREGEGKTDDKRLPPESAAPVDSLPYEQGIQSTYPKGPNPPNWLMALRNARDLVDAGLKTWLELLQVTESYARFMAAGGNGGVNIAAHNFFDRRKGNYWEQTWELPAARAGPDNPAITWRPPNDDEEPARANG